MKLSHSLEQIQELLNNRINLDFIQTPTNLKMENGGLIINNEPTKLSNYAHNQLATLTGIGSHYYNKMLNVKDYEAIDYNVNKWLNRLDSKKKVMLRVIKDGDRKILNSIATDSYKRVDNKNLMTLIPKVLEQDIFQFASGNLNHNNRLDLKFTSEKLKTDVKVGDTIQLGFHIQNSEDGSISLFVSPFTKRLICNNGATAVNCMGTVKYKHLTSKSNNRILDWNTGLLYPSIINSMSDINVMMENINNINNLSILDKIKEQYRQSMERKMGWNITDDVIDNLRKEFTLSLENVKDIVNHVPDEGFTQWGLFNAITRVAQNVESYEESTKLEQLGGNIVSLNDNQWNRLTSKLQLV